MKGFRRAPSNVFRLLLAVFAVCFAASLTAQRVADLPTPTDYVSDIAHVLSPEAIAGIDQVCAQLDHSKANAQIAVVTVQTLDGDDAADYANQLEDKWKIGRKGTDKGVLILLAVRDHQRRIDVGYGLEGILPDGKLGDIGRAMVPDLRAGDYDGAVTQAVGQVAQVIAADANVTLTEQPAMTQPVRHQQQASAGQVILIIIAVIFFGGFFVLRLLMSFGLLFGGWGRGPWIGGGGFGGGGFGGGGGGGGFGGFGGGGFGGGGAGGSW